jgi:hypothetical protein
MLQKNMLVIFTESIQHNCASSDIQNKQVTSLQAELGHPVDFNMVKRIVKGKFGEVFGLVV